MKKLLSLLLTGMLAFGLAGCSSDDTTTTTTDAETTTITVAATPTPHAEILEVVKPILAEEGITLEIMEFTDYVQPNLATESGDVDANYFQHQPYLDDFNAENDTHLVTIAAIHYEPLGIYAGKTADVASIPVGGTIAIPSDTTNEARALLLLEEQGLITLDPEAGITATPYDITGNPLELQFMELEAAQIARSLQDVDLAVINGNYALQADLTVADALAIEEKDSLAAETYANILVVLEGNEENEALQALADALKSEEVKTFIDATYEGAVEAMF